jgi:hypothetical protein
MPEKNDDRIEAVFTFDCDENPASDVLIRVEPLRWTYVRYLQRTLRKAPYSDCNERVDPQSGTRTIRDARLPVELLRLGLGESDNDFLWMNLNDLDIIKNPKKGASDILGHKRIVRAIVRSTPTEAFGPNAYDVGEVSSKIRPDTTLTVTVK